MNQNFMITLMHELNFPEPAQTEFERCLSLLEAQGYTDTFDGAIEFFYEQDLDWKLTEPLLEKLSVDSQIHRYTIDILFWLACCETLRQTFAEDEDSVFLETMGDLYAKVMECHEVYGIWGTFVSFWYPIFFSRDIVKLGRFEYENIIFDYDLCYEKNGITIQKGTPVKSIHIPSHFGALTNEIRMDSYRKAYQYFADELEGKPLICICHSWLLHNSTKDILPQNSNIVSFYHDFELIEQEDKEEFDDAWRVFGATADKQLAELPEKTSMQKAYKQYLLSGGKTGVGLGVLIFDGEKII
ncbi:acyltransferase domain-containing protein [Scatolibacter rhodanostii]|uniref:acyltransferase domain-containing protein n=1 Tax=Scatolibacter rhodanostii TaxID=2014781 RepID=UPI000C074EE9|nr:acyltransferase domain-containing protein [Scatolibacter rhodanostii]